jgi:hypothetical protein
MAIVKFRIRRDSAADWTSVNPTLGLGEPGLETDTNLVKYGDGATAWASLGYQKVRRQDITGLGTGVATALGINLTLDGSFVTQGESVTTLGVTASDSRNKVLVRGTARGIRFGSTATAATIGGVDQTGTGSHQPLEISGSTVTLQVNLANIVSVNSLGIDVTGIVRCDSFRLDAGGGTAPATAGATGAEGTIRFDANYIYVCTATNTWKRAAIATW